MNMNLENPDGMPRQWIRAWQMFSRSNPFAHVDVHLTCSGICGLKLLSVLSLQPHDDPRVGRVSVSARKGLAQRLRAST